jgi:hypothetical protein
LYRSDSVKICYAGRRGIRELVHSINPEGGAISAHIHNHLSWIRKEFKFGFGTIGNNEVTGSNYELGGNEMSRIRYLLWLVLIIILVLSTTASSIEGNGGYYLVVGRQDGVCGDTPDVDGYACDSERVQAAVDNNTGGKILLKGEFHFAEIDPNTGYIVPGTDQFVDIRNDIEISGQKTGHVYKTKIVGGWDSFRSGVFWMDITPWGIPTTWWFPNDDSPHRIAIRDIHFDNPYMTAIHLLKFDGAEITGNRFTGGRSHDGYGVLLGLPYPIAWHMKLGVMNPLNFLIPADASEARGKVLIDRNTFDGQYQDADPAENPWAYQMFDGTYHAGGTLSFVVWIADVEVTVSNNLFDNLSGLHHGAF